MSSEVHVQEHRGLRIAVEGCGHGELDKIYETMQHLEQRDGRKIDLLVCCGDFQAVRNQDDLECMACPPKYRHIATFYKYYSGEKVAPYPTIFIGGNHEASNYLWELYHGGWVAPNIYFLGYAGVINFGGIRIAGLSGIYKAHHYPMGHFERPPYSESSMRSAYHVRMLDVNRLLRLQGSIDVFLSHDWPAGIARHGDINALLRRKSFLRQEIDDGSLGSPPAAQLLETLRPAYWFSAHLHTKFAALVEHPDGKETRFLSLDKCLPGRQFLQIIDFPDAQGPLEFSYDTEWLGVLRATHNLTSLQPRPPPPPPPEPVSEAHLAEAHALLEAAGGSTVPQNFQATAPAYVQGDRRRGHMPQSSPRNPQTLALFHMLSLSYNLDHLGGAGAGGAGGGGGAGAPAAVGGIQSVAVCTIANVTNPEEIDLGDDDGDDVIDDDVINPEEIELDDEEVEESVDQAVAAILGGA